MEAESIFVGLGMELTKVQGLFRLRVTSMIFYTPP